MRKTLFVLCLAVAALVLPAQAGAQTTQPTDVRNARLHGAERVGQVNTEGKRAG